ncbi:MAG: diguanylate cyclase [Bacillota bacterium]|nr:diguanylate cyclase [Bacillota bacterium]
MDNINILLCGFLFTLAILMVFLTIYSAITEKTILSATFSCLCAAISVYIVGYGMELYSKNLERMMFWNGFQYIGIPFIPALWLLIAVQFYNRGKHVKTSIVLAIISIPILTVIMRLTNEWHYLFYAKYYIMENGFFPILKLIKGPWYIAHSIYSIFCTSYSSFLYLVLCKKASGYIKRQSMAMIAASTLPVIAFFLDILNMQPYGLDYVPFTVVVSSLLFLNILFSHRFFNLKPLARDKVFECTNDGIIILDTENTVVDFNFAAESIIPDLKNDILYQDIRNVIKDSQLVGAILYPTDNQLEINRGGITRFYHMKTAAVTDKNNITIGSIITITDVTNYVDIVKRLDFLASHDDLTGLYNRRYFIEWSENALKSALSQNQQVSLVMLDLDNFKNINDTYGHQAGDITLKTVSGICSGFVDNIGLLGRFGGEEFVIFLPQKNIEEAAEIAEEMRRNIESCEIKYGNTIIKVTSSFGISGGTMDSINKYLTNADRALYEAKAAGRNCIKIIK